MSRFLLIVIIALFYVGASAQTDDFRSAYDSFKNQAQQDYDDFRSRANAEYAEWVKKAWKEFKTIPAVPKPKDETTPPVVISEEDKRKPKEDKPVVIEEVVEVPEIQPQPVPVGPIRQQPQPVKETRLGFTLYGTPMEVRVNEAMRFTLARADGEGIAEAWKRLASTDCNNLIRDCLELRIRHRLCDWAYLRMLETMSWKFLGRRTNEAELLKAFVFCQSGYQMRLAFEGDRLHMLFSSDCYIFEKPCWNIGGTHYFGENINASELSVCEAEFPHERAMSMAIAEEQLFAENDSEERLLQSYNAKLVKASAIVNENLMMFCTDYPASYFGDDFMTRWALYANTPMSETARRTLYPQLKALVEGKDSRNAVEILCHWVQTAFKYEKDDEIWGYDRAFFADETLYYPYCDCEDRSILLTRIVRDLLGLKCALVYYPGHLATAIAIDEKAIGDYLRIDGTKYLICDPTYIDAPIGLTMPNMDNKTAKVIVLR